MYRRRDSARGAGRYYPRHYPNAQTIDGMIRVPGALHAQTEGKYARAMQLLMAHSVWTSGELRPGGSSGGYVRKEHRVYQGETEEERVMVVSEWAWASRHVFAYVLNAYYQN